MGQTEYHEEYVEQVFYLWYDGGRKEGNAFINSLPEAQDGRKPSKFTVIDWKNTRGWVERADALDAEVSRALDEEVINKRKKMWEEAVEIADKIIVKGMAYLDENGIKSGADALRAIDLGITTKRSSVGMAEAYTKISQMSDAQLNLELQKMIGKKPDAINAEVIEEE